ncbi:MAG: TonB C-terminal domain-containing protein [Myxococcota bacterium]
MSEAYLRPRNEGFAYVVSGSAVLHGLLIVASIAFSQWRPAPAFQDALPVELVQLGKPRDPNLLPRKVRRPPPPESKPAVVGQDTPQPDAVPVEAKQTPPKTTQPRKTSPKLSDAARQLLGASDSRLDDAFAKIEEPEGSPEGFEEGNTTDPNAQGDVYAARVQAAMKAAYKLPSTISPLERASLRAQFRVWIGASGQVLRYEVVEAHSNQQFIGAITGMLKTVKLPAPPSEIASAYAREGRIFGFSGE